jgi:YVTN family beta-propeller protein
VASCGFSIDNKLAFVGPGGTIEHFCPPPFGLFSSSSNFEIAGYEPPNLVLGGHNLSSMYGTPILYVYDRYGNIINSLFATQVSGDGGSATFPFPKTTSSTSLPSDIHGMAIMNWVSPPQTYCQPIYDEWGNYVGDDCWEQPGELAYAGGHHVTIGTPSDIANRPFGVDAFSAEVYGQECFTYYEPCFDGYCEPAGQTYCTNWWYTEQAPIVTLNASGQVYKNGALLSVGAGPTVIKVYRSATETTTYSGYDYSYYEERTQPSRAIVLNSGSNSVTVLDLVAWQVLATIPVGIRPSAHLILPDETKAYVTNYDSSSLSEIDLQSNTVSRTLSVGYHPTSLAMDPSGGAIWVGGQGWLWKINTKTLAVLGTYQINGTITSMAASAGQNSLIYTAVTNASAPNSTNGEAISYPASNYTVRQLRLSDMSTVATISAGSAASYEYSAAAMPMPAFLSGGTQISVNYGNGISISATPEGFLVMVAGGIELMRGRTATPVRGIAADPPQGVAYLTLPDSNKLITIPIPPG